MQFSSLALAEEFAQPVSQETAPPSGPVLNSKLVQSEPLMDAFWKKKGFFKEIVGRTLHINSETRNH
jgi:hypothetical protein